MSISFLMKMITDRLDTVITRELSIEKITASQCRALSYLLTHDGEAVSQKDIASYLGVSHTTIKGIVQRLECKGLVRTASNQADKRVKNVFPTDELRRIHGEVAVFVTEVEDTLLKGIPEAERELLKEQLKRMYGNIAGKISRKESNSGE